MADGRLRRVTNRCGDRNAGAKLLRRPVLAVQQPQTTVDELVDTLAYRLLGAIRIGICDRTHIADGHNRQHRKVRPVIGDKIDGSLCEKRTAVLLDVRSGDGNELAKIGVIVIMEDTALALGLL